MNRTASNFPAALAITLAITMMIALVFPVSCANRLAPHADLLAGVPAPEAPAPRPGEVAITYLGVNGYLLRSHDTALLVDPFFSRIDLRTVALNAPMQPSPEAIAYASERAALPRRVDAFLVTHGHFDHLFDTPPLQRRLGGKVIASPTSALLCEASGIHRRHLAPSLPGAVHQVGGATVHVLPARHALVFGRVPYPGLVTALPETPPERPADWLLGTPLSFLVEMEGQRIYIESGGHPGVPAQAEDVDLAILGLALRGSRERYPEALRSLRPRYVLPSHQDNFFLPLESGFQFSGVSDFPSVLALHRAEQLPGELILMDYFHTWTLRPAGGERPSPRAASGREARFEKPPPEESGEPPLSAPPGS